MRKRRRNPSTIDQVSGLALTGGALYIGYRIVSNLVSNAQVAAAAQLIAQQPSSVPGNPAPGTPGYLQKSIGQ